MKAALTILLMCFSGPAIALSCMAPDVAQTFSALNDEPETYVVVHGTLTFDASRLPVTDWENQDATPPETLIPARLSGASLTREGFVTPFDRAITLNAICFGPWCVSIESGADVMAFVEYRDGAYVFALGPCYFTGFFAPDEAMLNTATACMRAEACEPQF